MRRGLLLAPLLAAAALGLAGCGTAGDGTTVPTTLAAPPQTAKLDWLEPFPATAPALVFGVASFAVTEHGWSADISIDNRSDVGWKIVDRNDQTALTSACCCSRTTIRTSSSTRSTPSTSRRRGPRRATSRRSRSCSSRAPRGGGRCRRPARSPAASGCRFVFGPFSSVGEAPKGLPTAAITWYTDHAYHLEEVAAVPA